LIISLSSETKISHQKILDTVTNAPIYTLLVTEASSMSDRTNAERQRRYITKLKAAAAANNNVAFERKVAELQAEVEGLRDRAPLAAFDALPHLVWEIDVDDELEGYVWAYEEPYGLYVRQLDDEVFFWHVDKDTDDGNVDVAEGEASSLVAAMVAAEAAIAKAADKPPKK
jgi:hypothetical protein